MPKDPRLPTSDRRSLEGTIATLVVGAEEKEYKVHQSLLSQRSPFFASSAKEGWKEGREHRVPLPDDAPSVVDLYVQWVYGGKIYSQIYSQTAPEDEGGDEEADERGETELNLLLDGFVFGEKVQDRGFRDAIVDALIHSVATPDANGVCWFPTNGSVDRLYKGTPEGSPMRRLLVDLHVFRGSSKWLEGDQNNAEFTVELARRLIDREGTQAHLDPTKPNLSSCRYHHHGKEDECYGGAASVDPAPAKRVKATGAFSF